MVRIYSNSLVILIVATIELSSSGKDNSMVATNLLSRDCHVNIFFNINNEAFDFCAVDC